MKRYLERINELMRLNPRLKPVLITLTVKNGKTSMNALSTLQAHLERFYSVTVILRKRVEGLINFAKLMVVFIRPNTPTTKRPNNGIRIFIFLHY